MILRRFAMAAAASALVAVALPGPVVAQKCEGNPEFKPGGGKYTSSGELYITTANKNTKPQDKRRNYQLAINILEEGFAAQPKNPRNYLMVGEAYVGMGFFGAEDHARYYQLADSAWDMALDMWICYEAEIDTARYNAWTRAFNRGINFASNDQWDVAIEWYRNAWAVYDMLPQPQLQIGTYYAQIGMGDGPEEEKAEARATAIEAFEQARAAMNRATRLRPAEESQFNLAMTFNLAQLLAFEQRYEESAQTYGAFLATEPDDRTAQTNMAVVLVLAANQKQDAAERMEDGPDKDALNVQSDSLRAAATVMYEALVAVEDLSASEYYNVGVGLLRLGENDEALVAFKRVLERQPYRVSELEQIAFTLFNAQRYDTLAVVAEVLVERYPSNLNNLAILANAYRELDRSEDALVILERREALQYELTSLDLVGEPGAYQIVGAITNIGLEPGTQVEVTFDLYDNDGELAGSTTLNLTAPDQGVAGGFQVPIEGIEGELSGFTYHAPGAEGETES
jgi:tetratricopeptide (TPR) repeat protein